jgi:site-specific recombinase XerD
MVTLLTQSALVLGHTGKTDDYDWHALNFEKVHQVRTSLIDTGYSVNTVNLAIAALRGVTKTAFNLGKMSADDMLRINAIRSLKGRTSSRNGRCLSKDELRQLIDTCADLPTASKQLRDKAILLVGAGAGLRCAEICALQLEDINIKEEKLVVEEGKGRKQRQIYLAPKVLNALNDWTLHRGCQPGPLFSSIKSNGALTDSPLTASGLTYTLKSLQERANTSPFSPHDLRRTFITHMLEQGVDLNTVRQLAGHSDVSTTVRYDKRDEARQKLAAQSFKL